MDNTEKVLKDIFKNLDEKEESFIKELNEKIRKSVIEKENLSSYVATFGSNQEHEGKYILIHTESYKVAVGYMEEKYPESYCMVYPYDQWEKWESEAKEKGLEVETLLEEIVLVRKK